MVSQLSACALEVRNIHKAFYGNPVLKGVSFGVTPGETLGLLGANGAGKSTLMKIINGVYQKDSGQIFVKGNEVDIRTAQDAMHHGISMVYQEFSLIPTLTVAQNMYLGVEPKSGLLIKDRDMAVETAEALDGFGLSIDPNAEVGSLSIGNQQMVEILKALQKKPSVLILDEPTASLTLKEIEMLFAFIKRLKEQKIAIFLISHHMQEIMDICDRAVVLRDGVVELDERTENLSIGDMVQAMVGKEVSGEYLIPAQSAHKGGTLLQVSGMRMKDKLDVDALQVREGEIVGLAGLLGSGRTELLESIFGIRRPDSGEVLVNGKPLPHSRPWTAIEQGVFLVPEDRRRCGIVGIHSIWINMLLPIWKQLRGNAMLIDDNKSREKAGEMREKLDINCTSVEQELNSLSGGNQQKVVFAKSLLSGAKILLLDDPTTGIDVEAKASIARIVREVADNGGGVLIASSEMEELARLCDRVLIMSGGHIVSEVTRDSGTITQTDLEREVQTVV